MTVQEFQEAYHTFRTHDEQEARDELVKILPLAEGFEPVIVKLEDEYCLMTRGAADMMNMLGIFSSDSQS